MVSMDLIWFELQTAIVFASEKNSLLSKKGRRGTVIV